jgi:hypothetical protein
MGNYIITVMKPSLNYHACEVYLCPIACLYRIRSMYLRKKSTIPANSLGILANSRHIIILNLLARPSYNLQNDLVQCVGSKDVDVIARVGPASRQCYLWVMR